MRQSMKNIITRVLATALLLTASAVIRAQPLELAADAPDRYIVVKGDTLWDISGRFLSQPWRWPEIWALNREQIANPHLIYPGDVVILDRSGQSPRLRLGRMVSSGGAGAGAAGARNGDGAMPVERLQPRVRAEKLEQAAVPTISASAIEAFLNRPLIVEESGLATHPRIVAGQDDRVFLSPGDLAYARGIDGDSVRNWHIYRRAKPIVDPDTRETLAWEALFVGSARLERPGDPASLRIISINEEIGVGDRLIPAVTADSLNFAPRPPEGIVEGRIVAVYRGLSQVGKNSVVALSAGRSHGVEPGVVLGIRHRGRRVVDRETRESIRLPDESVGYLLVFRTFDKISYGLVMKASHPISVGDVVTNP
jgi:hypothetical protein